MEKLLVTVSEASQLLSLGRTIIYRMVAAAELPSVTVGRQIRLPVSGLREWAERQAERREGAA